MRERLSKHSEECGLRIITGSISPRRRDCSSLAGLGVKAVWLSSQVLQVLLAEAASTLELKQLQRVTKEEVGFHVLPTRSLFGGGILRRLLRRVSLAKPTSALLRS